VTGAGATSANSRRRVAGKHGSSAPYSDLRLAIGAVPFFLFYALCRAPSRYF